MTDQPSKDSDQKPTVPWALLRWLTVMEPNERDRAAIIWGVAEIQRLTAENESTRQSLHQVTAAYDKLLKRMGAVRRDLGTDPHFEAVAETKPKCPLCDDTGSMSDGTACPHLSAETILNAEPRR